MIDGTYAVEIDTPMGRKSGMVTLRAEGDVVHADVDVPVVGRKQADGKIDGNTFTAKGTFKMLLVGKVDYSLRGEVTGDDLHVVIDSTKGGFNLVGVRI